MGDWFEEEGVYILLIVLILIVVILSLILCWVCFHKKWKKWKKEKNEKKETNEKNGNGLATDGAGSSLSALGSGTIGGGSSLHSSSKGSSSKITETQMSTAGGMVSEGFEVTDGSQNKAVKSKLCESATSIEDRPTDLKYKPKEESTKSSDSATSATVVTGSQTLALNNQ